MTDILNGPTRPYTGGGMRDLDLLEQQSQTIKVLDAIRIELLKMNPNVLATPNMSGTNPIPVGDTRTRRIVFEVGGLPSTVYRIIAFSTYTGVARISPTGMNNLLDGMTLTAAPISLIMPLSELYLATDGAAICPVNQPAHATNGGIKIFAFTIPVFENRQDRIPTYAAQT